MTAPSFSHAPHGPSRARIATRREFLQRTAAVAGPRASRPASSAGRKSPPPHRRGPGAAGHDGPEAQPPRLRHRQQQRPRAKGPRPAGFQSPDSLCLRSRHHLPGLRPGYATFEWIGGAIKGLPREKLFLQSKIPGQPQDILKTIDHHRQVFQTDYIDSLLIHCMIKDGWTDPWKRIMDAFEEAKAKKWIRAKGVSCHSLPALRTAVASDWPDVHLVRVNPQAKHIDGPWRTGTSRATTSARSSSSSRRCTPRAAASSA